MTDFLLFFNDLRRRFPLHLEIYYSRTLDWCIKVWKMGCAKDYPNSPSEGKDAILVSVQDADMKLCFAKAQVALKEWMRKHNGGY